MTRERRAEARSPRAEVRPSRVEVQSSGTSATDRSRVTVTRRSVLGMLGGATVGSLAGCLGSGRSRTPTAAGVPELATRAPEPLPAPRVGDPDAPVTVEVFVDFACPHCRSFHEETLPRIEGEFVDEGVVGYEHRDFPLPVDDPESYRAANAARAVQSSEGPGPFFEYVGGLFENQADLGLSLYESLADDVGADPETVRRAAERRVYERTVDRDVNRGDDAGVESTPTVLVDGEIFRGRTWSDLVSRIEAARADPRSEPS